MEITAEVFSVDRSRLDLEWEKQATAAFECGRLAAQARLAVEDIKRRIDVARAEANMSIRRDPAQYGLIKPTESAIDAVITSMPSIKELGEQLCNANYQFSLAMAGVTAIDNKKKALDNLTQLLTVNYYSAK